MWQEQIDAATEAIFKLFTENRPVNIGFSAGKDSSTVAALAMLAAVKAKQAGFSPVVVVTTADTLIDNPVITPFARREQAKLVAYGKKHGFQVIAKIASPSFLSSFLGKIIGGSNIPTFPGSSDCSVNYKIRPQTAMRNTVRAELAAQYPHLKLAKGAANEPVVLIGTRFAESARRSAAMTGRNESATEPQRGQSGYLELAPIAHWELEDVWMFLLEHRDGERVNYSDFVEIDEIYGDAGGGSTCGFRADLQYEEGAAAAENQIKQQGCGARFGCSLCVAVQEDKSLETMIRSTPEKYGFLAGHTALRKFIVNTRWDWSRRNWVGRTVDAEGYLNIEPDTYSPAMVLELYRYMLSLQYTERRDAAKLGIAPRFVFVTEEQAFALDIYWALNGYHAGGTALQEYRAIMSSRAHYAIPDVAYVPRKPYTMGKLKIEDGWMKHIFGGLRNAVHEMATFDTSLASGCGGIRLTKTGGVPSDLSGGIFAANLETLYSAEDFMECELEEVKGQYAAYYQFWQRLGGIDMNTSTAIQHDEIARRTQWRESIGIVGQQSPERLLALCDPSTIKTVGREEGAKVVKIQPIIRTKPATWQQPDLLAFLDAA